jgi:hypothetical protein
VRRGRQEGRKSGRWRRPQRRTSGVFARSPGHRSQLEGESTRGSAVWRDDQVLGRCSAAAGGRRRRLRRGAVWRSHPAAHAFNVFVRVSKTCKPANPRTRTPGAGRLNQAALFFDWTLERCLVSASPHARDCVHRTPVRRVGVPSVGGRRRAASALHSLAPPSEAPPSSSALSCPSHHRDSVCHKSRGVPTG